MVADVKLLAICGWKNVPAIVKRDVAGPRAWRSQPAIHGSVSSRSQIPQRADLAHDSCVPFMAPAGTCAFAAAPSGAFCRCAAATRSRCPALTRSGTDRRRPTNVHETVIFVTNFTVSALQCNFRLQKNAVNSGTCSEIDCGMACCACARTDNFDDTKAPRNASGWTDHRADSGNRGCLRKVPFGTGGWGG